MGISGNHQLGNFVNNGQANANARTFNADGSPARLMELDLETGELNDVDFDLEDLANFNNYSNNQGGNTSIQGTHGFKNMSNA